MSSSNNTAPLRFVIKHNDKFYLTHELWEFDPSIPHDHLDDNQKTALAQIPGVFRDGRPTQGASVVGHGFVTQSSQITPSGTSPPAR